MHACINSIKTSIIFNKKGFIVKNNSKNLNLLKAFLKINIIKFIKMNKNNNELLVYINYLNAKPVFKNVVNLFRSSNKKFLSLKELKHISYKSNFIIILSTNKGILNNFEAIKFNVGGLVIAEIWN